MENMLAAVRGEAEVSFASLRGVRESWSLDEAPDMGREVTTTHQQWRRRQVLFWSKPLMTDKLCLLTPSSLFSALAGDGSEVPCTPHNME